MRFYSQIFLLLLILIRLYYYLKLFLKKKSDPVIFLPEAASLDITSNSTRLKLSRLPEILKTAAIALLIIAMARPQGGVKNEEVTNQGIDILLVMDTSTSMNALDFKPSNRLEAAKKVAKEFVKSRNYDRIGIVAFAGFAFTQCPLTVDHEAVLNYLDQMHTGMTEVDGTAIGSAIALATSRLKSTPGKSKVMILLTDGRNNRGEIDPMTASQAAEALGIKIYTIGAGQPGGALYEIDDPIFGKRLVKMPDQELDEQTLAKIAETTGGRYFRATNSQSLSDIFKQIDQMEKVEIKTTKFTSFVELFHIFLWPGAALLLLSFVFESFLFRTLP